MKVLHLLGERADLGGILSVIRGLDEATSSSGYSHHVWVNSNYVESRRPALSYRYSRHMGADSTNHLAMLARAIFGFVELNKLLHQERFDILHAHSRCAFLVALGVAALLRRPILFTNHTYGRRTGLYRRATRLENLYTVVLTPSMAKHYGLAASPPKISIISACCADVFFAGPLGAEATSESNQRPLRLVGIGNIVRWKNWHLLFEALMHLSEQERRRVEFHHWGGVPPGTECQEYNSELRGLIRRFHLGSQVFFRGATCSIAENLRNSDWFVLPSTNEPCSVALIEALALGLPALVSASGGNLDIIQNGKTGLFFEAENSIDLAVKLSLILRSQIILAPPGEIRDSVRSRSASTVARQYVAIYEKIAACD